ncbi:MAG: hypothetical protein MZV64_37470 [Ignavibacteriales bacterium]|nr:hypothetical protein [Ignavibacteriales bacterium]
MAAIPYSQFFKDKLTEASQLLKEAPEFADNASLKSICFRALMLFFSNDYYQSDMDWMDLKDHNIEGCNWSLRSL